MSSFNEKFSSYTMSQLNEVLEDDEKLSDMVQDMEEMHGVQQSKETTLVSNRTLAEQNLDLQPRLEQRKETLTQRYARLQENFESFQLRKSTLGCLSYSNTFTVLPCVRKREGPRFCSTTRKESALKADTDHTSGNTSLDILLALLQAEGAKIEEETEVSVISSSMMTPCFPQ
ncbi:Vacuolar protein sorting-associated protein 37B [Dissostichus eleginoides]|uniref:Vacuolar protein sorting-associated protein 37B n=1 Tax=Dissostichus eleginoides TaxID=100907 RepID=A0AAD9F8A8_DISEL|nr:Vacuolar protein sorting-associated protein 37B [Dissostichus eleginoides]